MLPFHHLTIILAFSALVCAGNKRDKKKSQENASSSHQRVASYYDEDYAMSAFDEEPGAMVSWNEAPSEVAADASGSRASTLETSWEPVKYSVCRPHGNVTIGPRIDYSRRYGGFLDPDAFAEEEYRERQRFREDLFQNPHYEGSHDEYNRQQSNDQTRQRAVKHISHRDEQSGALYVPEFDEIFHHPEMSSDEARRRYREEGLPLLYIDYDQNLYHFEQPS